MSFIRSGQARKKRAFVRKKPQWDDSVTDLDSYRATPDEIRQRREAHKSKNHLCVKLEKIRKEKQKQRSGLTNVEARQVAIMKEVLHDQQQLDSVLTRTDQMLATVKDLFGDDAKKFTGHPNVTLPPGSHHSTSLPGAPQIRTQREKIRESVMSQSAINDLSGSSEDDDSDEGEGSQRPDPIHFQPRLDLQRFQQFLQEEENRNSNAVPSNPSLMSQADLQRLQQLQQILLAQDQLQRNGLQDRNNTLSTISGHAIGNSMQFGQQAHGPAHSTHLQEPSLGDIQTPPNSERTDSGGQGTPPRSALNDTGKVRKSRRRVPAEHSAFTEPSSMNMTDMRKVLECLQAEIADFERKTGRRSNTNVQDSESFTGYTVALVTAVTKLTHYMKETELRLQAEMMVREQLAQDVGQLTITIDSLTQEMIVTQEEYGKMANEFQRHKQQVQGEMALLQAQVLELKHQQSGQGSTHSTPSKAAGAGSERKEDTSSAVHDHEPQPAAAVLLSPLVRKTRVPENDQSELLSKPKRQTSLVDIPGLVERGDLAPQHQQPAVVSLTTTTKAAPTSSSHHDPPRLTQTLPVMATVSVPRPIPLVQSNVGLPLPGSQAAGPIFQQSQGAGHGGMSLPSGGASGYSQSQLSASTGPSNPASSRGVSQAMETQIAELNRQHAEAQQRLHALLVQQKRQHDQVQQIQEIGSHREISHHPVQQGTVPNSVSPPISPISVHSEYVMKVDPIQRLASMSREIKVAMPMVDLEVSAGSLNGSL